MSKKAYIFLPGIIGVAFIVFFSSCARLSYDDMLFAARFKTNTFAGAFDYLFHTHAFRWTTFLVEDLILGVVPADYYPVSIPAFFILFYSVWVLSIHSLLQEVSQKYAGHLLSRGESIGLACLIITTIYFFASQVVESFTSMIIVTDRLLPLLIVTWTIYLLVSDKVKFKNYMLLICAFLLAGTAENVSITVILFFGAVMLRKIIARKARPNPATILFFGAFLVFFALENLSPGRSVRLQVERTYHFSCGTDGVYCANTFPEFIKRFIFPRHMIIPLILLPFSFFTSWLPIVVQSNLRKSLTRAITIIALAAIPVILFHFISAQWVFDCYGPMRMWFTVNTVFAVLGIFFALRIGASLRQVHPSFASFLNISLSAVLLLYFGRHIQPTLAYTRAYDSRICYLREITVTSEVVKVKKLPSSDMVIYGDIMDDENDDVNRDFCDTYGFHFKVRKQ